MQTIDYSKFNSKHISHMKKALTSYITVAEGAIRSGKTVDHCLAAALLIESSEDRFHLATGSTVANAKLNIGDCNGYGLQHIFAGRCRWTKYLENEALEIQTARGIKYVIFSGGGKKDSFKKILGNSYGVWIATEINNHFISEDNDCFIDVAFDRTTAAKEAHVLWDLNPGNPNHAIYTKYIDYYAKQSKANKFIGGYNYQSFILQDNGALTEEQIQKTISRYDPATVNYRRNILGQRVQAEGLIFRMFADNPSKYIMDKLTYIDNFKEEKKIQFSKFISGVDFGGNKSKTTFVNTGYVNGYEKLIAVDDYKIPGDKGRIDPNILSKEFISFLHRQKDKFGEYPEFAFCDNAEQYLINGLYKDVRDAGIPTIVCECYKATINGRIDFQIKMFSTERLFIYKNCKNLIKSLQEQVWDKDKQEDVRLDDGVTADIDTADGFEYTFSSYMDYFIFL